MIRITVTLFALMITSIFAIIAGYFNPALGRISIEETFKEIPVIKTSIMLTIACPLSLLVAFYTSRGSFESYRMEYIAACFLLPFIIVFATLPGALDRPAYLGHNLGLMLCIIIPSQLIAGRVLQTEFWKIGGRKRK